MPGFDPAAFRAAPLPTEAHIAAGWKGDASTPAVSVVCITYQHRDYVEDALRGFLTQRTDFPFEIVVHDDASTDGTAAILQDYQRRYPRIVRPVIQAQNQYSQGRKCTLIAIGHARGEYVALCEGDDFWTDPDKLALQHAFLHGQPQAAFVGHPAYVLAGDEGSPASLRRSAGAPERFDATDVIRSRGQFLPTASFFFRRSLIGELPPWFEAEAPVGDFFLALYAVRGREGYCLDRCMAAYRLAAASNWTSRTMHQARNFIAFKRRMVACYEKAAVDFPGQAGLLRERSREALQDAALVAARNRLRVEYGEIRDRYNALADGAGRPHRLPRTSTGFLALRMLALPGRLLTRYRSP